VKIKGDTVWIEKYRNLYVDRLKRDSVFLNDTVRIPYPVEGNCVSGLQNFQIWTGRILAAIIAGYFGVRYLRKRFFIK
jgi:hypothetical protein